MLKAGFENATTSCNTGCCSVVNCTSCLLHLPLTVSESVCGIQNVTKKCISCYQLQTVNQFFHPTPHIIIQCAYVWSPGWPIVETATSHPLPRETIVQEIDNFTSRMRRSSVMLEIHTTLFIRNSMAHPPNVRAIPPAKIWGMPLL